MYIEIRERGGKKLYYLAHSLRDAGRVRKFRRYLGADLTEGDIAEKRSKWETVILNQVAEYRKINDPLHIVLSEKDLRIIDNLISKIDIRINHLSEEDWLHFTEHFTYDTNAIEGSTVTVSEVRDIIESDRWPSSRSREEIAETYGVAEAIKYIRETGEHLSLELIQGLHKTVFRNSKPFAGELRGRGVEVVIKDAHGDIIHRGAPQQRIKGMLNELIKWYDKSKDKYHPIVLAAVVHNQFENIHPFQDGNGRVGRLLLNNILLKHDLPPVNIELENRREYYESLKDYEGGGNLRPTIELVLKEYRGLKKTLKQM